MTVRLEELLAAATPGPWERRFLGVCAVGGRYEIAEWAPNTTAADFDLIALAPDAVRLLIDMGEAVRLHIDHADEPCEGECVVARKDLLTAFAPLLARLDRLGT